MSAGIIQLAGTLYFLAMLFKIRNDLGKLFKGYIKTLMAISIICFSIKTVLQIMSAIPLFTNIAFNNRYLVIAYIHMVFIGFISLFLFAYLSNLGWYNLTSGIAKTGTVLMVSGFTVTELLLISPAVNILISNLTFLIFLFSSLMVTGIFLFILAQFTFKKEEKMTSEMLNFQMAGTIK